MFLLIPLLLIVASAGGIFFIVWRKLPRLKKLAETESNSAMAESSNGVNGKDWRRVFYDLCPEVVDWARNIKVDEYKETWLVEMEKFLRRLRVASLKMDRFSDSLIKKIRSKVYSTGTLTYAEGEVGKNGFNSEAKADEREELKRAEQKLILEIAKNPKNTALYEELGDIYMKSGNYKDAKESYEAAIELNPNNEELKKKLSQALEKLHKPEDSQS